MVHHQLKIKLPGYHHPINRLAHECCVAGRSIDVECNGRNQTVTTKADECAPYTKIHIYGKSFTPGKPARRDSIQYKATPVSITEGDATRFSRALHPTVSTS